MSSKRSSGCAGGLCRVCRRQQRWFEAHKVVIVLRVVQVLKLIFIVCFTYLYVLSPFVNLRQCGVLYNEIMASCEPEAGVIASCAPSSALSCAKSGSDGRDEWRRTGDAGGRTFFYY
ncbi:hypothetical protein SEVIR_4G285500v4 [Setaria viridis]|uniref:Uncharacterized protein n=1 Tax=Setaria viridis TaxID=4556 RepID=A0A4U6V2M3_SETVI|nr:hypothetical protein SEVIR_4G285500v2 [Setaria viridis]